MKERAAAAKHGSLEVYAKAVHDYEIEPYQEAWELALDEEPRTAIICPPDTYKSTTVQFWIEMALGRNPNLRILWLMNAGDQAEKRVTAIQQTLEQNTIYRMAFPEVHKGSGQWTKTVLYLERSIETADPTLMGCGWNGPYQGLHFDIIILDDLTNQEDVKSEATMDLQRQKLRGVILDRLARNRDGKVTGRIVAIFTRWGENDLLDTFKSLRFFIIQMPIMANYPWGPTISNRRFPPPAVEEIRMDKGPALFDLTYMCETSTAGTGTIQRSHIQYWTDRAGTPTTLPTGSLAVFMGVDPAASTKTKADYTSIATVGLDISTRRIYLLDLVTKRLVFDDLIDTILQLAQHQSSLIGIGVETIGFQLSIVQHLRRVANLPIRELPYRSRRQATNKAIGIDKDKYGRALYLDSLFVAGRFFIPANLPIIDGVSWESEFVKMPDVSHDDRTDAITFACALADAATPKRPTYNFSPSMPGWDEGVSKLNPVENAIRLRIEAAKASSGVPNL